MEHHKEGMWWTSLYNEVEETQSLINPAPKVEIQDTTLRDGEQTPGIVFSVDEKVRIAEMLNEIGVERIEAGMIAVSPQDREAIYKIASMPNRFTHVGCLVRAMTEDIDKAVDCGVDTVIVECPAGYPKLKYQYGWSIEQAIEKSLFGIQYAKSKGLYVSMSPFDTTRALPEDMEKYFAALMGNCPPDSITILDTMGSILPSSMAYMVRMFKRLGNGISVEAHTHNDFGMAVANEVAAIAAGADVVHSCVLGLGERTGNAALEELIVCMKVLLGLDNDYALDKLDPVCKYVSELTGRPIPENKPVVGRLNYTRESGMGADLVVKNPLVMFATNPELFGKTGEVALGKKSGKLNIKYWLDRLGLTATDEQVGELVTLVKQRGIAEKRMLTAEEFREIAEGVLSCKQ